MNQRQLLRLVQQLLMRRGRGRGRSSIWSILAILVIVGIGYWQQRASVTPPQDEKVTDVLDGDSLVIFQEGERREVRLYAIDCPEKGMPHGQAARDFTRKLVQGKTVSLRVVEEDRYQRLVSEVLLEDGRSLNEALVEAGWAWWYRNHAEGNRTLERLEKAARKDRRGLWADDDPEAPWDFRRRTREN